MKYTLKNINITNLRRLPKKERDKLYEEVENYLRYECKYSPVIIRWASARFFYKK